MLLNKDFRHKLRKWVKFSKSKNTVSYYCRPEHEIKDQDLLNLPIKTLKNLEIQVTLKFPQTRTNYNEYTRYYIIKE